MRGVPAPTAGDYRADTTLIWAVPDRAPAGWRRVNVTSDALRLPQDLRRSLPGPPRQPRPRTLTAAQPDDQPGTVSTVANLIMKPGTTPADLHRIPDAAPERSGPCGAVWLMS